MGAELNRLFGHPPLLKVVPMDRVKKYIYPQVKNKVPLDKGHNVSWAARTNFDPPELHSP